MPGKVHSVFQAGRKGLQCFVLGILQAVRKGFPVSSGKLSLSRLLRQPVSQWIQEQQIYFIEIFFR